MLVTFAGVKRKKFLLEKITVTGYAAEGKSVARFDGKVYFVEGAVPGDVVDVFISTNKKDWGEGKATHIHEYSPERVTPFCRILANSSKSPRIGAPCIQISKKIKPPSKRFASAWMCAGWHFLVPQREPAQRPKWQMILIFW